MKHLHPITIVIIILVSLYLLTGCQTKVGMAIDKFCAGTNTADPYHHEWYEKVYGGRPRGIDFKRRQLPFAYKDFQENPDRRGWHWDFK